MALVGIGPPARPVGHSLWVRYRGSQEHHQRLVLAVSSGGSSMYIVTPDYDHYVEDYSRANPDVDSVRWSLADGSPPDGVPRNLAYRFRTWPDNDTMEMLMRAAERAIPVNRRGFLGRVAGLFGGGPAAPEPPGPVQMPAARPIGGLRGGAPPVAAARGLEAYLPGDGAAAAVGGAPPAAAAPGPAAPPGAPVSADSLGGAQRGSFLAPATGQEEDARDRWVAAATMWAGDVKIKRGCAMRVAGSAPRGGRHAIQEFNGVHIPCYNLLEDDPEEFLAAEGEYDARVLAVKRGPGGNRMRSWRDVVEDVGETAFDDFPVEGPRTVRWCVEFIGRRQGGPMDHHRWWVQSYGLNEKDPAVAQHELTMKVLELMGTYDQLDLGNSAGLERLLRKAQLTEWHFEERRRALVGGAAGGADGGAGEAGGGEGKKNKKWGQRYTVPSSEEAALWTGATKDNQHVMVCPALLKYVSKEAESQVLELKATRKAREERALAGRDG